MNTYATGYISSSGTITYDLSVIDREHGDCWIIVNDTLDVNGWYILNLEGRDELEGAKMGKCFGYLEGVLTQRRLFQSICLFKDELYGGRQSQGNPKLNKFYSDHLTWLFQSINSYPDSLYWQQIAVICSIFNGLYEGYNSVAPDDQMIDYIELSVMVATGDSMELMGTVNALPAYDELLLRCTAIIKLIQNSEAIFFAHNSWTDYRSLHFVVKNYNLPCLEFKITRVSLSTTLGLISSVDDYFINDQRLMVFETTFTLQNRSLFCNYLTAKSVMNWMRTILAMFTSTNVIEWEDQFLTHNSGTYNNDYYVVDSKLLRYGEIVKENLVHSIAQLPGPWRWIEDLTEELYREGFIVSFNVPHNKAASDFMEFNNATG
jgi:hypothetical protein